MRRGRCKLLTAVLAVLLCCGGCSEGMTQAPTDYAASAFEASIAGEAGGVSFEALVTAAAPAVGGDRDVSLEFFTPETLAGVKIVRQQGVVRYECGGLSFESGGAAGWLDIADLLCAEGRVTEVEKLPDSALVSVAMSDGDRALTLVVDVETGHPVSATLTSPRKIVVRVLSFREGTN